MNKNRAVNITLVGVALGTLGILAVIEGLCALWGIPTISERLAELRVQGGEVFVIWAVFTVGLLCGHFWAGVSVK